MNTKIIRKFYCINHESWAYPDMMDYVPSDCLFVTCPPPELPADWIEHVTPPSPEELVQIDQNAMELAFDLELS